MKYLIFALLVTACVSAAVYDLIDPVPHDELADSVFEFVPQKGKPLGRSSSPMELLSDLMKRRSPTSIATAHSSGDLTEMETTTSTSAPELLAVIRAGEIPLRKVCLETGGSVPTTIVMFNDVSIPVVVSTAAEESDLGVVYIVRSTGCMGFDTHMTVHKVKSSGVLSIESSRALAIWSGEAWTDRYHQKNSVGMLSMKLDSDFSQSVQQFFILNSPSSGRPVLYLGSPERAASIFVPVSVAGKASGHWQVEGSIGIDEQLPVQVRINTAQPEDLTLPESIAMKILADLAQLGTVRVDGHKFYLLEVEGIAVLPIITIAVGEHDIFSLTAGRYLDPATGLLRFGRNWDSSESDIIDIGFGLLENTAVHFDVANERIGFS